MAEPLAANPPISREEIRQIATREAQVLARYLSRVEALEVVQEARAVVRRVARPYLQQADRATLARLLCQDTILQQTQALVDLWPC